MKSKIIKSILIPTLGMLSTGVVTPMVLSSCFTTVLVQSISINKKSLTLGLNESEQLTATVLPENATNRNVTWNSSNGEVAIVDENGKVTAIGIGKTTITATTKDGEHTATCEVNVFSDLIIVNANSDSTLELVNKNNNPNLQYSTDQENWNEYINNIEILKDTKLYLKGNNPNGWSFSDNSYSSLIFTGNVSVSGNVMGLLDNGAKSKEQSDITDIPCDYCFCNLFNKSNGVCEISNDFLPAINLTEGCYKAMFHGCESLTKAPDLPATELADRCYSGMFDMCKSLTTTPNLPATVLAKNCYDGMFYGCESLENAPKLPAVNLTMSCYWGMFYNCESLTKAPDLPAVELAESCYSHMFYGCTHLNYVWIKYSDTYNEAPLNAFNEWVEGCSSDGVFYYKGSNNPQDFHFPSSWVKQSNNLL